MSSAWEVEVRTLSGLVEAHSDAYWKHEFLRASRAVADEVVPLVTRASDGLDVVKESPKVRRLLRHAGATAAKEMASARSLRLCAALLATLSRLSALSHPQILSVKKQPQPTKKVSTPPPKPEAGDIEGKDTGGEKGGKAGKAEKAGKGKGGKGKGSKGGKGGKGGKAKGKKSGGSTLAAGLKMLGSL